MAIVKFDKSVKYQGIRYDAHEAFNVDDADLEQLIRAGATIVEAPVASSTPPSPPEQPDKKEELPNEEQEDVATLKERLVTFNVNELIEFAKERNIDLQDKTRKADIYNAIVAAL